MKTRVEMMNEKSDNAIVTIEATSDNELIIVVDGESERVKIYIDLEKFHFALKQAMTRLDSM